MRRDYLVTYHALYSSPLNMLSWRYTCFGIGLFDFSMLRPVSFAIFGLNNVGTSCQKSTLVTISLNEAYNPVNDQLTISRDEVYPAISISAKSGYINPMLLSLIIHHCSTTSRKRWSNLVRKSVPIRMYHLFGTQILHLLQFWHLNPNVHSREKSIFPLAFWHGS